MSLATLTAHRFRSRWSRFVLVVESTRSPIPSVPDLVAFTAPKRGFCLRTESSNIGFIVRDLVMRDSPWHLWWPAKTKVHAGVSDRSAFAGRHSNLGDVHGPLRRLA
jgi:hypothetical protein